MGRMVVAAAFVFVMIMTVTVVVAEEERVNNNWSTSGLFWSTSNDEATEPDGQDSSVSGHLDGGFSSLEGMFQWAIGHSDPQKLKETAQRLSPSELMKRQLEIKQVMDELKMPSDAQLMQIAIDDLKNSSSSLDDHHRALQELLILIEPIDNANDLGKLGGIPALIQELDHPDSDIRRISAWVLGKASQNNPIVQKQVLELGAVSKLMLMVKSNSIEEGIKSFYAVSALIRNNIAGQELFYALAGDQILQNIVSNSSMDIRLRRKAVALIADLAEYLLDNVGSSELAFFSSRFFLKSLVDLTSSDDLDLQEKALVAIKNLLQLKTTEPLIMEFCGLDDSLERMRKQLQVLMAQENYRDYAMDVESLRGEVELIYHSKRAG